MALPTQSEVVFINIVDRNDFDNVMMRRIFSDREVARKWARAQVETIKRCLMADGEELLDIEYEEDKIWLDNDQVVNWASAARS